MDAEMDIVDTHTDKQRRFFASQRGESQNQEFNDREPSVLRGASSSI